MSERDEFEAWAKDEGYQIDRVPIQPSLYNWASTQCCWEAWQAARAQQAVPALTAGALDHVEGCGCAFPDVAGCAKRPILAAPQPS